MFLTSGSQIVTMEHLWNINLFSSFSSSETICAGVDQRKLFCFSENEVLFFNLLQWLAFFSSVNYHCYYIFGPLGFFTEFLTNCCNWYEFIKRFLSDGSITVELKLVKKYNELVHGYHVSLTATWFILIFITYQIRI